jgi:Protein of unknown function (DUF2721)
LALFTDSPLAGLTIVVAPAILTNASSILCLGTANRLARVIDHTRVASAQLTRRASTGDSRAITERQLDRLEIRSVLLLRALRLFYISLGSFATGALIALFGAIVTISVGHGAFTSLALVGLSGTIGVTGLVMGCAMMVQETRIAVRTLADDRRYRHASMAIERVTPP